jgi:Glycosyl hydrolases family 2, sugar binding domain/Glycosyl hydrolases family 2/Glycosyl hydrolases family 2, TIM barrel domain
MRRRGSRLLVPVQALLLVSAVSVTRAEPDPRIPLPEHPRPDFERAEWVNLNGDWAFRFDPDGAGARERWFETGPDGFPRVIRVPFPWGSKLSGVNDEADVAWYARRVRVPESWKGKRVFLVVGASDWKTTGWLDGQPVGGHQGGYTPFELELTKAARPGADQRLVLRVDDSPHPFKLEGKQGYGKARGLWQTVYLEARPAVHVDSLEFHPDLASKRVELRVRLSDPAPAGTVVDLRVPLPGAGAASPSEAQALFASGGRDVHLTLPLGPDARPWALEDPYLYEATVTLTADGASDRVTSYFGLRQLGTAPVPGLGHPYVSLNGKPVYLQITLDQGWHPEGFTTWPSDAAMRDEVLLARRLGLNAIRTHVKVELPRKLYWADRLGVLVMSDVPNSWGEPDEAMRKEWETAFRGMVRRDFNHPSIFSWVLFNEQWGLQTKGADGKPSYLPATQEWVGSCVDLARQLDPTRLVEDNSPCCGGGHVKTDLNSWHLYLPGWKWKAQLDEIEAQTYPGSTWNFMGGRKQGREPMLNSECGNVWGYEGSTGDVDWSFDYHAMMDELRRHPKVAGWLYTEHHDVVNEWNGYVRADRSEKETGIGELAPGMTLRDWHAPLYVAAGSFPTAAAKPGETVLVPLWASFLADAAPGPELTLKLELVGRDDLGRFHRWWRGERKVPFAPWTSRALEPVAVRMPDRRAVAVLRLALEDPGGRVLHRNFTAFVVGEGTSRRDETLSADGRTLRVLRVAPTAHRSARWSLHSWEAMDGRKQNGAGAGYFEYRLAWPREVRPADVAGASFLAELGAKELFGKDRPEGGKVEGDFMRGSGTHDPGLNPNAYPMTDVTRHPSAVRVLLNGVPAGLFDLPDDPADHRGLLSWHAQKRDGMLREAGSYGYLVSVTVPPAVLREAAAKGEVVVRLEVDEALPGGLAVYGEGAGRYPLDPTLVLTLKR